MLYMFDNSNALNRDIVGLEALLVEMKENIASTPPET